MNKSTKPSTIKVKLFGGNGKCNASVKFLEVPNHGQQRRKKPIPLPKSPKADLIKAQAWHSSNGPKVTNFSSQCKTLSPINRKLTKPK